MGVGVTVRVRIPAQLRSLAGGAGELTVGEAQTVGEVLAVVASEHPELAERILDAEGEPRRFVNVFVRDEDIRFLDGLATTVGDGDVVSVVPAVAGG
ncbi:thiamineS protein [Acidimicrobium ferrooxidans DSM 10331]|uniref:ThiamineS protein n=1 Tax=Acidimicrobium ferrooxidans (strain DSM 10331 / JCM 15462 / NBRC 103882 / ICP) TaxID=525909 RepID=C7M1B3_ACIFD|nr:ubiquitin-like small modifier protein 1 [Acidimicrobium ferrooxidans]ACU54761.1 thiamineS protein [Acidimicrobium ferrooxidans DSM 10331]